MKLLEKLEKHKKEVIIFAAIVIFIALVFIALAAQKQFADFVAVLQGYGYLGGFVLGFLSSFTLFIPSPAFFAVLGMASFLNPLLLGIATGIGSGIGEMTGYVLGRGAEGASRLKDGHAHKELERIRHLFKRYQPDLVVFAFAALPLLPIDILGIFCGLIRYDWKRLLAVVIIGKIIKFTLLAYFGLAVFGALRPFFG